MGLYKSSNSKPPDNELRGCVVMFILAVLVFLGFALWFSIELNYWSS